MSIRAVRTPVLLLALAVTLGCQEQFTRDDSGEDVEEDTSADTSGDTATDTPVDTPPDTTVDTVSDTPVDTVEEDGTGPAGATPFFTESSGGAHFSSPHYRLDLFIGPVRPVGEFSSPNYGIKLGPGGTRSH